MISLPPIESLYDTNDLYIGGDYSVLYHEVTPKLKEMVS